MRHTVVLSWDDEGKVYSANVPALPGCHTWGRTRRSAVRKAKDAIETYVGAMSKLGLPVPREVESRPVAGCYVVGCFAAIRGAKEGKHGA